MYIVRKKGDVIFINSKNGWATTVEKVNGQWYINSFHIRTSNNVPNEMTW